MSSWSCWLKYQTIFSVVKSFSSYKRQLTRILLEHITFSLETISTKLLSQFLRVNVMLFHIVIFVYYTLLICWSQICSLSIFSLNYVKLFNIVNCFPCHGALHKTVFNFVTAFTVSSYRYTLISIRDRLNKYTLNKICIFYTKNKLLS